jgi:peptidyl-prolyl cis-trans isomerase B (cyclophilin B)
MAARIRRWRAGGAALLAALGSGILGGCGGGNPGKPAVEVASVDPKQQQSPAPAAVTPPAPETPPAAGPSLPEAPRATTPLDGRLHQSWEDAVSEEVPEGLNPPPEQTRTGKNVGKLNDDVYRSWDHVFFETPAGKVVRHQATLHTKFGDVVIDLRPDLAPNHARNFIALARLGYYDGLVFERAVRQQAPGGELVEALHAGCPLGVGTPDVSHLGYFLKPEFNPEATHEEGTIGAWHDEDENSASCRFYVTLGKVPGMNGHYSVFGKVSSGLDVLRRIHQQPTGSAAAGESDRPTDPVVIEKITITSQEVEKPAAVTKN